MKSKLLLYFVIFLCFSKLSFPQITLNSNNFPAGGLLVSRGYVLAGANALGSTGPNQFYDFTNIVPLMHDSIKYYMASQTPWAAQHPGTTVAYAEKANNINYIYYCASNANAFCRTGITMIGDFGQGWDTVHGSYTDTDTLLTNQYSYGHVETERSVATITNIQPFVNFKIVWKRNIVVDGWGHLETPLNSYADVLRVKYAQYRFDTASYFGTPVYTAVDTQYFYNYFAKDVRHPVVTAHTDKQYNLLYFEYIYNPPVILGCIDPAAVNFNPLATQSDGSCVYCPVNFTITPDTTICAGTAISLQVSGGSSWLWSDSSTSSTVTVSPSETGVYSVLVGDGAACHVLATVKVTVDKPVTAQFWTTLDHYNTGDVIQFIDLSSNATIYQWNFDDAVNGLSSLQFPLHTYTTPGMKHVLLIASNTCFADSLQDSLMIYDNSSVTENAATDGPDVYPNPATTQITLEGNMNEPGDLTVFAIDMLGRRTCLVTKQKIHGKFCIISDISRLPSGMYIMELEAGTDSFLKKWIKTQ